MFTAPVIGLIGKKRSGKDTFAQVLVDEFGYRRVAFADPLRAVALAADPYVRIEADEFGPVGFTGAVFPQQTHHRLSFVVDAVGWERAKAARDVRRFLQRLGSEGIRSIAPMFWVDTALRTIADTDAPVVVTDVRFPNEANALRALGGTLVRIVRPGTDTADAHASETALDAYVEDYRVNNAADVATLHEVARVIARAVADRTV